MVYLRPEVLGSFSTQDEYHMTLWPRPIVCVEKYKYVY